MKPSVLVVLAIGFLACAESTDRLGRDSEAVASLSASNSTLLPATSTVTTGSYAPLTLTIEDITGAGVSGVQVTFSGSGKFSLNPQTTTTTTTGTTGTGGVLAFYFLSDKADTGAAYDTVTVTSGAVKKTAQVQVQPGNPAVVTTASMLSTVKASKTSTTAISTGGTVLTITALDQFGNPVPDTSVTVAGVTGDSFKTTGAATPTSLTASANSSGVLTVTWTSTNLGAETASVTFNAGGAMISSPTVTFVSGPAVTMSTGLSAEAASVTAGSPDLLTLVVTDAAGHPKAGLPVTWTASGSKNLFTPVGPTQTSSTGTVTSNFSSTDAQTKTITASAGGVSFRTEIAVKAAAPSPSTSTLKINRTTVVADGTSLAVLTVTALDQFDNPISGANVTFACSGPPCSAAHLTPSPAETNGSGVATVDVSSPTVGDATFTASIAGVAVTKTTTLDFMLGPPSVLTSSVVPGAMPAYDTGVNPIPLTVLAEDAQGRALPGIYVRLTATPGWGRLVTPISGKTNANGYFNTQITSNVAGVTTVTVNLSAVDDVVVTYGNIDVSTEVTFIPFPVVSATQSSLVIHPASVAADGTSAATLTTTVKNALMQPLADVPVIYTVSGSGATLGETGYLFTGPTGVASTTLTATKTGVKAVTSTIGTVTNGVTALKGDVTFTATCPTEGQPRCGGVCVDTSTNNDNCGACGNACPAGESCSSGACQIDCSSPDSPCTAPSGSQYCADLASDNGNCGACTNACGAGLTCLSFACQDVCLCSGSICTNSFTASPTLLAVDGSGYTQTTLQLHAANPNGCAAASQTVVLTASGIDNTFCFQGTCAYVFPGTSVLDVGSGLGPTALVAPVTVQTDSNGNATIGMYSGSPQTEAVTATIGSVSVTTSVTFTTELSPPAGLVAYFSFDDGLTDSSGNNVLASATDVTFVPGFIGSAASFAAADSAISLAGATGSVGSPMSFCAWVNPSSTTSGAGLPVFTAGSDIFGIGAATNVGVGSCQSAGAPAGVPYMVDSTDGCEWAPDGSQVTGWGFLCWTYSGIGDDDYYGDPSSFTFYENGYEANWNGSYQPATLPAFALSTLLIGSSQNGDASTGSAFNGLIDEVSIWSVNLQQSDVMNLYGAALQNQYPFPLAAGIGARPLPNEGSNEMMLETTATSVAADGTSTATLTATLINNFGNPVSGQTITFTGNAGDIFTPASAVTGSDGSAVVTVASTTTSSSDTITATGDGLTASVVLQFTCPIMCNGACADLQTDNDNCGGCGQSCGSAGATCSQGVCSCAALYNTPNVYPSGSAYACTSFSSDPNNCGGTGNVCSGSTSACVLGTCAATPGCGAVASGLLAYYSFDNGTTTSLGGNQTQFSDWSGNGYSATGTDVTSVPGILGQGARFSAADSQITIDATPNDVMLGFGVDKTMCAWVMPDAVSGFGQPVFQMGGDLLGIMASSGLDIFTLYTNDPGPGTWNAYWENEHGSYRGYNWIPTPNAQYVQMESAPYGFGELTGGGAAPPNTWSFLCWSDQTMYVNGTSTPLNVVFSYLFQDIAYYTYGVEDGSLDAVPLSQVVIGANTSVPNGCTAAQTCTTGTAGYSSPALSGIIDEVGIWNRLLSVDEMNELYASGAGCRPSPPCTPPMVAVNGACVAATGCADGTREGFTNQETYPYMAGCAGGWTAPGITASASCGNNAGNSSSNPNGTGCAAADLCASGYHICSTAEVSDLLPSGAEAQIPINNGGPQLETVASCGVISTGAPGLFFATSDVPTACASAGPNSGGGVGLGGCGSTPAGAACSPLDYNYVACPTDQYCDYIQTEYETLSACTLLDSMKPTSCAPLSQVFDSNVLAASTATNTANPSTEGVMCCGEPSYATCAAAYAAGNTTSGLYSVNPDGTGGYPAWCDMTNDGGGWTTFYAGINGAFSDFAQFESNAVDCPNPQTQCLRPLPQAAANASTLQVLASCGGAAVVFTPPPAVIDYLANGVENQWVALSGAVAVEGSANASRAQSFWTGSPGNPGWILTGGQDWWDAVTFASSYDENTQWDECNGVQSTSSAIALEYKY